MAKEKMEFLVEAVCENHIGKVRRQNQDNFLFDGKFRNEECENCEKILYVKKKIKKDQKFAIFDGMGGEAHGDVASYTAAKELAFLKPSFKDCLLEKQEYLQKMVLQLNDAVVNVKEQLCAARMGTTMALLFFTRKKLYICNVGDSRIYRFRSGELQQVSEDHVERRVLDGKKSPLTRYLGMDSEEILIEPYLAEETLCKGDIYLICSDGITDMLTNSELAELLGENRDMKMCVHNITKAALGRGGYDNITVIVCKIE